jgi:hypothetical protein
MSFRSSVRRSALGAAALAVLAWTGPPARAADVTPPAVPSAVPVTVNADAAGCDSGAPGCAGCQGAARAGRSGCASCGRLFANGGPFHRTPNPYPVNLCPGACFGYFQTQWRRWDEVCPLPYLGQGVSDDPRLFQLQPPPTPKAGAPLTPPRPLDSKTTDPKTPEQKKTGSDLPPLPTVPGKFVP